MSVFDKSMGDIYRAEHQQKVGEWIVDGSFKVIMDETKGIDNAPIGLAKLFAGKNLGKAYLNFQET